MFICYTLLVFPKRLHIPFRVPSLYVMSSEPEGEKIARIAQEDATLQAFVHNGDSKVQVVIIINGKDEVYDWENMIKFKIFGLYFAQIILIKIN